ncbi:hypothetical protein [Frateuria defendens]|uniref:hypothetical protein n=1 Tax=Frateuria defendens TaxID=2219559 RepID=UPI001293EA60|nr:hypothetical protein [Frateuria defendens]
MIVEYKFGTSKLGSTIDGKQMSDSWSTGAVTGDNRLLQSVGDPMIADDIQASLAQGRIERWVVHTDPSGQVTVGLVDKSGSFIQKPNSDLFKGVGP